MKKGLVIAAALLAAPLFARAADAEPGKVIVGLYHAAPGKQLELLKWLAARDAVDKEAGVAATQIYAHTDGDSWDYLVIAPQLTDAEGAKVDEIAKKKGLKVGFPAGLEFRSLIQTHTDTYARGPTTAAELVKAAGGK
ncbi:MAG TPA: hypothetical protein VFB36_14670 [Nevskiaceae bacterium]|nr:hypothetical protein [Nevskiaceae bacterium]